MNLASTVVVLKEGRIRAHGPPARALESRVLSETYGVPIEVIHTARGPAVFWDGEE
jgi:ABC-type cobalamin/Fe3+-siderophores transport system ATPase subunit